MIGVILTGASRGLGKALFDLLKEKDIFLLIISRRFLPYQEDIAHRNQNIVLLECDLSKIKDLAKNEELLKNIPVNNIDKLVFINNAGVVDPIDKVGMLENQTVFNSIFVNFIAPILIVNKLMKIKLEKKIKIEILNISTGAAKKPYEGWSMYCSTKAGLKMFLDVLNAENKETADTIAYHIDPGIIDTDMQKSIRNSNPEKFPLHSVFVKFKTDGMLAQPEKVAKDIIKKYLKI